MTVTRADNGLELRQAGQEKQSKPFFPEEREGWNGYVEWEKYPEKKKQAEEILAQYKFPEVCCVAELNCCQLFGHSSTRTGSRISIEHARFPAD